jgi:hypothetical protein
LNQAHHSKRMDYWTYSSTLWILTAAHLVVLARLVEDIHHIQYLERWTFHVCIMLPRVANKIKLNHDIFS